MTQPSDHQPVMLKEVLQGLSIRPDGVYVDGTFGRGGHAAKILAALSDKGRLIVMDKDPQAIAAAQEQHAHDARVTIIHDDYARMKHHIEAAGLALNVDGVLLDLGVSSPQLDDAQRGFSFQTNGPLDMRMNNAQGETAAQWLMQASEQEIADVLWRFGEERFSRRIARRIVEYRQHTLINDTDTLASLIRECVPSPRGKEKGKHPATRSFQAIRIRINRELDNIQTVLDDLFHILKVGGRLLVISFHSLEDRIIKQFIRRESTPPRIPKGLPLRQAGITAQVRLRAIGKAIKAGLQELADNPRAQRGAQNRRTSRLMRRVYWLMLLVVLVTGSALTVVYVKHESRVLFAELRQVQKLQDEEMIHWGRLQLQNSTLLTQANVETMARKKLGMVLPDNVQIVTLPTDE